MSDADTQRQESFESWQAAAAGWSRRHEAMRAFAAPVSAWMLDALAPQPGAQLLELAAGVAETGLLAAELVGPAGKVLITDQAPAMIEAAEARAAELGVANVEFKEMSGEWIDLATASVDGVLCRWGYMLMVDPESALRETRRVLRPGGRVVLAVWDALAANPWSSTVARVLAEEGLVAPSTPDVWRPGPFALGDADRVAEMLAGAGLVDARIETLDLVRHHADFDDFWETSLDLSSVLHGAVMGLDAPRGDALRERVREQLAPYVRDDGSVAVPGRTLVACAEA